MPNNIVINIFSVFQVFSEQILSCGRVFYHSSEVWLKPWVLAGIHLLHFSCSQTSSRVKVHIQWPLIEFDFAVFTERKLQDPTHNTDL